MGLTWGPPWSCRPQMGPMLAPWTLLSRAVWVAFVDHWCVPRVSRDWTTLSPYIVRVSSGCQAFCVTWWAMDRFILKENHSCFIIKKQNVVCVSICWSYILYALMRMKWYECIFFIACHPIPFERKGSNKARCPPWYVYSRHHVKPLLKEMLIKCIDNNCRIIVCS